MALGFDFPTLWRKGKCLLLLTDLFWHFCVIAFYLANAPHKSAFESWPLIRKYEDLEEIQSKVKPRHFIALLCLMIVSANVRFLLRKEGEEKDTHQNIYIFRNTSSDEWERFWGVQGKEKSNKAKSVCGSWKFFFFISAFVRYFLWEIRILW